MKPGTSFEFYRWTRFLLFWFFGTAICVVLSELVVGPTMLWTFHDVPYQVPSWHRALRLALFVVFMGIFGGTVTWIYDKKSSGR